MKLLDGVPRPALPILLLTFVNAIGGTLLIPVLPFVVRDLGYSDFVFSLLIAAYPAAQFFAAPILGSLADNRGRRPICWCHRRARWPVGCCSPWPTSPPERRRSLWC